MDDWSPKRLVDRMSINDVLYQLNE